MKIDPAHIPTPCYVCDETALERNLKILDSIQQRTGCNVLLALKGFAMFSVFPLVRKYLSGVSASSLDEARLGYEEFGKEVHLCAPAYRPAEFVRMLDYCSHVVFNSFSQWRRFKSEAISGARKVLCGIRINPEHSEVSKPIYDPCGPYSRLGVTKDSFTAEDLGGITGLHFHSLCELGAQALERTLDRVEEEFGDFLKHITWINFGGGHHITRDDYDIELLCRLIRAYKNRYSVDVYLEPGETVVLNAGVLVASVLDIIHNKMDIAILDTSAAAHMPDVLEAPYRPDVVGAAKPGEFPFTYRLGGMTCLAGDIIGDYSFPKKLTVGQKLIFRDMAHYTMVKNNTFNGLRLPAIALREASGEIRIVREFFYEDYRNRLS